MHIELIKFYEITRQDEKQHLIGTLHIRLPEIGLNIKGITVFKKKFFWYFRLPGRKAFDQSLGKEVNYACILFDEKEKNDALFSFLQSEGKKFVEDYLSSTPETPKLQPSPAASKAVGQSKDVGVSKKPTESPLKKAALKVTPIPKPQSITKMATLDFVDPPKRSSLVRSSSKFARQ